MSNKELKEATEEYINVVLNQAEEKAGISMTEVLVESTAVSDKLSSSLLIVAGATLTLCIGNSDRVITTLGSGTFKILMIFLLFSAILGFTSKFSHAFSLIALNTAKELIARFELIFDEYDKFEDAEIEKVKGMIEIKKRSPSLSNIFQSFINSMPIFLREGITKSLANKNGDSKKMQRTASTAAIFHIILFASQALFLIIAFFLAVFGVE